MKHLILGTLLGATLAIPASAQSAGDASVGEADFRKCKACHMIETPDGEQIVRGGRTGPICGALSAARSDPTRASNTAQASRNWPR